MAAPTAEPTAKPTARLTAHRHPTIECVSHEMARVLAKKSGAERLAIAAGMFRSARRMIESHLRTQHPEWNREQLQAEVARRLAHGAG